MPFDNKKEVLYFFLAIYLAAGTLIGLFGAANRNVGYDGCKMQNLASYAFVSYYAVCELFKPRFDLEEK